MERLKLFLKYMVDTGKISQTEADTKLAKHIAKEEAKQKYKDKKSSLTKTELQGLLDILIQ